MPGCLYISQGIDIENHRHFCSLHHLHHLRSQKKPGFFCEGNRTLRFRWIPMVSIGDGPVTSWLSCKRFAAMSIVSHRSSINFVATYWVHNKFNCRLHKKTPPTGQLQTRSADAGYRILQAMQHSQYWDVLGISGSPHIDLHKCLLPGPNLRIRGLSSTAEPGPNSWSEESKE